MRIILLGFVWFEVLIIARSINDAVRLKKHLSNNIDNAFNEGLLLDMHNSSSFTDREVQEQLNPFKLFFDHLDNTTKSRHRVQANNTDIYLQTNNFNNAEPFSKVRKQNGRSSRNSRKKCSLKKRKNKKNKRINSTRHFCSLTRNPAQVKDFGYGRRITIKPTFQQGRVG